MNKQMAESKTAVAEQAQAVNATAETQAARATEEFTNIGYAERKHSVVGGKCLQFECGEANASVDLYTGRLLLTLPLFRNQDTLPVSLIYNSFFYDALQKGNRIGYGMGLSFQCMMEAFNGQRTYLNGAGIAEYFDYAQPVEAKGTSNYEDASKTRKFRIFTASGSMGSYSGKYVNNQKNLIFPNGEQMSFDQSCCISIYKKLCNVEDVPTELKFVYNGGNQYAKTQLDEIKKGDETFITLSYYDNTKLVKSITKGTETVNFGYSNGYLKTVQRVDGG